MLAGTLLCTVSICPYPSNLSRCNDLPAVSPLVEYLALWLKLGTGHSLDGCWVLKPIMPRDDSPSRQDFHSYHNLNFQTAGSEKLTQGFSTNDFSGIWTRVEPITRLIPQPLFLLNGNEQDSRFQLIMRRTYAYQSHIGEIKKIGKVLTTGSLRQWNSKTRFDWACENQLNFTID